MLMILLQHVTSCTDLEIYCMAQNEQIFAIQRFPPVILNLYICKANPLCQNFVDPKFPTIKILNYTTTDLIHMISNEHVAPEIGM